MTGTDTRRAAGKKGSGMDQLREEVVDYLGVRAERLADSAGDRMADLTDRLLDVAEGGEGTRAAAW